jgi:predicted P-loop ATPase
MPRHVRARDSRACRSAPRVHAGRDDVEAAIATCAEQRPFHPIQNYLRSVDWDGVPRLASMAYDYFGSESTLHPSWSRSG